MANVFSQGWQWQNPLPFGDAIEKVYFVDDQHGWILPKNATLLRTADGGGNWELLHINILFTDIHFINPLEGWGIGRPQFVPEIKRNIYHTVDGGLSWEIQLADTNVYYDIFFVNELYGWATSDGDLFHTHDGGDTWLKQAGGEFRPVDIVHGVTFLDTLKGWAVGGLLWGIRTFDGGQTWERDSSLAGLRQIIYTDTLHLWGYSGSRYVRRSTDGGENWEWFAFTDILDGSILNLVALDNEQLFAATNYGIYASSNGGQNWSLRSGELMNDFAFLNSQEGWGGGIGAVKVGLFHTLDGGFSWENLVTTNNPFGYEGYVAVDFVDSQTGWLIGSAPNFILKTTDGGQNWFEQPSNPTGGVNLAFIDHHYGWIVGWNGRILHTSDGGENWQVQNSGTGYPLRAVNFVDHRNGWAVGGDFTGNGVEGVILRTTDSGQTWIDQTPPLIPRLFGVSFVDSLTGWAVGGGGSIYDYGIIMHTSNGGESWTIQQLGFGLNLLDVEFVDATHGWAVGYDPETEGEIIHTSDGGLTWHAQLNDDYVSPWNIKAISRSISWVCGTHGDIYHTSNGGESWVRQQSYTVQWLRGLDFIDESTGWIVGWNGTILHTETGGITFITPHENPPFFPQSFILHANYPNPFNPETTIPFQILKSGARVQLLIFDMLGRKIRNLFDGELPARNHVIQWDGKDEYGRDVSSGIYFYRLEVDRQAKARKMLKLQ
ncbi:hypothetical protein YTPLAS21_21250 [Candidatus Nitrosocosmicus sp.]|nr:hypothetical protein YTPLAS21_21250 [Candidatus Nitrosocosmicus sp.]